MGQIDNNPTASQDCPGWHDADTRIVWSHMNRTRSVILDRHEPHLRTIRYHAHVSAAGTLALCGDAGYDDVERLADAVVATELVVDDVFNSVEWHCFIRSGQSIQGKGYVWLMFPFL